MLIKGWFSGEWGRTEGNRMRLGEFWRRLLFFLQRSRFSSDLQRLDVGEVLWGCTAESGTRWAEALLKDLRFAA